MSQEELIRLIEEAEEKVLGDQSWKKYYGDVCCRIFRDLLSRELPESCKLSDPNAYILGYPTEFDLLIVDSESLPEIHTNAYPPEAVRCGLEIKAHGVFGGRSDLEKVVGRIKANFDGVKTQHPQIYFIYVTYKEVCQTKRPGSIRYLDETIKYLHPYEVFCFKCSRTGQPRQGEWERLSSYVMEVCK